MIENTYLSFQLNFLVREWKLYIFKLGVLFIIFWIIVWSIVLDATLIADFVTKFSSTYLRWYKSLLEMCTDCANKWSSLLKQRIFTKTLTEVACACWLCEYRNSNEWYKNVNTEKSNRTRIDYVIKTSIYYLHIDSLKF